MYKYRSNCLKFQKTRDKKCVVLMNASFPVIILYVDMYTSWWSAAGGKGGVGSGVQPPLPVAVYMNVVCVIYFC